MAQIEGRTPVFTFEPVKRGTESLWRWVLFTSSVGQLRMTANQLPGTVLVETTYATTLILPRRLAVSAKELSIQNLLVLGCYSEIDTIDRSAWALTNDLVTPTLSETDLLSLLG